MQFNAGDAFQVHPSNDPALVAALLKHLRADGSKCAPRPDRRCPLLLV